MVKSEFLSRQYSGETPFTAEEAREFRQLLKDRPELKKHFKAFKTEDYQRIRSRLGRSPWLGRDLDMLFEIAAISGI